ncbi:membrane protein insertion efficiency factor YidD [Mariniluteicoccus flavus]
MFSLSSLAARGIDAYQRHLSPRKGYRCAHAVLHGGSGCSGAIRAEVLDRGLIGAAIPTIGRFAACASAYRTLLGMQRSGTRVEGFCCCNGIPIPIRF